MLTDERSAESATRKPVRIIYAMIQRTKKMTIALKVAMFSNTRIYTVLSSQRPFRSGKHLIMHQHESTDFSQDIPISLNEQIGSRHHGFGTTRSCRISSWDEKPMRQTMTMINTCSHMLWEKTWKHIENGIINHDITMVIFSQNKRTSRFDALSDSSCFLQSSFYSPGNMGLFQNQGHPVIAPLKSHF